MVPQNTALRQSRTSRIRFLGQDFRSEDSYELIDLIYHNQNEPEQENPALNNKQTRHENERPCTGLKKHYHPKQNAPLCNCTVGTFCKWEKVSFSFS